MRPSMPLACRRAEEPSPAVAVPTMPPPAPLRRQRTQSPAFRASVWKLALDMITAEQNQSVNRRRRLSQGSPWALSIARVLPGASATMMPIPPRAGRRLRQRRPRVVSARASIGMARPAVRCEFTRPDARFRPIRNADVLLFIEEPAEQSRPFAAACIEGKCSWFLRNVSDQNAWSVPV